MRHYFKRVIYLYIRKGFPTLSEALKNHPGTKTEWPEEMDHRTEVNGFIHPSGQITHWKPFELFHHEVATNALNESRTPYDPDESEYGIGENSTDHMIKHGFTRVYRTASNNHGGSFSSAMHNGMNNEQRKSLDAFTGERASYKDDVRKYPFSKSITPARRTQ
jgi:hypothetical protein